MRPRAYGHEARAHSPADDIPREETVGVHTLAQVYDVIRIRTEGVFSMIELHPSPSAAAERGFAEIQADARLAGVVQMMRTDSMRGDAEKVVNAIEADVLRTGGLDAATASAMSMPPPGYIQETRGKARKFQVYVAPDGTPFRMLLEAWRYHGGWPLDTSHGRAQANQSHAALLHAAFTALESVTAQEASTLAVAAAGVESTPADAVELSAMAVGPSHATWPSYWHTCVTSPQNAPVPMPACECVCVQASVAVRARHVASEAKRYLDDEEAARADAAAVNREDHRDDGELAARMVAQRTIPKDQRVRQRVPGAPSIGFPC